MWPESFDVYQYVLCGLSHLMSITVIDYVA